MTARNRVVLSAPSSFITNTRIARMIRSSSSILPNSAVRLSEIRGKDGGERPGDPGCLLPDGVCIVPGFGGADGADGSIPGGPESAETELPEWKCSFLS